MSRERQSPLEPGLEALSFVLGLISVIVAGAAGIGIGVTALYIAFYNDDHITSGHTVPIVSAPLTAGLICVSVCLALGSRISLSQLGWPLLGAAIAGLIVSSLFLFAVFVFTAPSN